MQTITLDPPDVRPTSHDLHATDLHATDLHATSRDVDGNRADGPADAAVLTGTVKWFNDQKGFGFILGDGPEGRDVFVHHSVIEGQGFKTLDDGEQVEYAVEHGPKGSRAVRVVRSADAVDARPRPRAAVH